MFLARSGKQTGFRAAAGTDCCTVGIWMWPELLDLGNGIKTLLLDTEGLYSIDPLNGKSTDKSYFSRFFVLTSFISTVIVFNQFATGTALSGETIEKLQTLAGALGTTKAATDKEPSMKELVRELMQTVPAFILLVRNWQTEPQTLADNEQYWKNEILENDDISGEMTLFFTRIFKKNRLITLPAPSADLNHVTLENAGDRFQGKFEAIWNEALLPSLRQPHRIAVEKKPVAQCDGALWTTVLEAVLACVNSANLVPDFDRVRFMAYETQRQDLIEEYITQLLNWNPEKSLQTTEDELCRNWQGLLSQAATEVFKRLDSMPCSPTGETTAINSEQAASAFLSLRTKGHRDVVLAEHHKWLEEQMQTLISKYLPRKKQRYQDLRSDGTISSEDPFGFPKRVSDPDFGAWLTVDEHDVEPCDAPLLRFFAPVMKQHLQLYHEEMMASEQRAFNGAVADFVWPFFKALGCDGGLTLDRPMSYPTQLRGKMQIGRCGFVHALAEVRPALGECVSTYQQRTARLPSFLHRDVAAACHRLHADFQQHAEEFLTEVDTAAKRHLVGHVLSALCKVKIALPNGVHPFDFVRTLVEKDALCLGRIETEFLLFHHAHSAIATLQRDFESIGCPAPEVSKISTELEAFAKQLYKALLELLPSYDLQVVVHTEMNLSLDLEDDPAEVWHPPTIVASSAATRSGDSLAPRQAHQWGLPVGT
eukprot:TRINITY_DN55713_c0_g1_i1.p1 TRINITY_DN55713_c0_g1~~TRINITY_DN55713_c0_g1_i1.p1  ORF type:complete len:808 (+),score=129.35 TRINITY_DN55713_c0_g1_i1:303-2426(+)